MSAATLVERVHAALTHLLEDKPAPARLWLAFSGGRDSSTLLHALAEAGRAPPAPLALVHVDHGLAADSGAWSAHCEARAQALGLSCQVVRLSERPAAGQSLEAWAREARYRALAALLGQDDVVLTAHHADDQAETFLLNALRGSGPAGLAGVAPCRRLGAGWLLRPMLEVAAEDIAAYATNAGLGWVEDPMNRDQALARSFLRAEILPRLRMHWPGGASVLARNTRWQREAQIALDHCADQHLASLPTPAAPLPVALLISLVPALRRAVLRRWIRHRGVKVPDARRCEEILRTLLEAPDDRVPRVSWGRECLRRWRGALYLDRQTEVANFETDWRPPATLILPAGRLCARSVNGRGLAAAVAGRGLVVRSRRGGERCRLPGRAHHMTLKHLLQDLGVPPWQRPSLPLVFAGDTLVAVANLVVCAEGVAAPHEPGWELDWQPATHA